MRANIVLDWNALMIDAIRQDNSGPTLSSRNLAIMHSAIYDAVNSIDRSHQPYRFQLAAQEGAYMNAAAVAAADQVFRVLYPSLSPRADVLYQNFFATVNVDDPSILNGIAIGVECGRLHLENRQDDGANTSDTYIPSDAPGQWRRTPPYFRPPVTPQWRYVQPFAVSSIEPYVPPPPPALDSPEYLAALREVKAIGASNSSTRTAEQGLIARFWSDFSYTSMPPGHWHLIGESIAQTRQLSVPETARLFLLLSLAQADAAIVCWEAKYRYNFWRPVTAIQFGEIETDPQWQSFLNAPPFPSYTSGHSTFSKASAEIMAGFFGADAVAFTATSDAVPGATRSFNSFSACADEIGLSRIYGGIHYSFDNVQGKICGAKIGRFVSANFALPNSSLPALVVDQTAAGSFELRLHGRAEAFTLLEWSDDLKFWTPVSTNQFVAGGVVFREANQPAPGRRFYRAKQIQ